MGVAVAPEIARHPRIDEAERQHHGDRPAETAKGVAPRIALLVEANATPEGARQTEIAGAVDSVAREEPDHRPDDAVADESDLGRLGREIEEADVDREEEGEREEETDEQLQRIAG